MAIVGWVATHTGLPSLHVTGPALVTVGERTLCVVGAGSERLVSDALAVPGVAATYVDGSQSVTLTRRPSPGLDVVSNIWGRAIPMLRWERDEGKREWNSDVVLYPGGGSRRPEVLPARTGSGRFVLMDPVLEDEAWRVLQSTDSLIIAPGLPVPGLPPLIAVDVQTVARSIARWRDGILRLEVSWTEAVGQSGAAEVVTWGEWQAFDHGWKSRTMLDLARLIAGMPA